MKSVIILFCLVLIAGCATPRVLVSDCQSLDGSNLQNCKLEKKL